MLKSKDAWQEYFNEVSFPLRDVSKHVSTAVFAVYDGVCIFCKERKAEHVDHIVPHSLGGPDRSDNFAASCTRCNLRKHDKLLPLPVLGIALQEARRKAEDVEQMIAELENGVQSTYKAYRSKGERAVLLHESYILHRCEDGGGVRPVARIYYKNDPRSRLGHHHQNGDFPDIRFSYGRKFLKSKMAHALSPGLPLEPEEYKNPEDFETLNLLRDMEPDHWGRSIVDYAVHLTTNRHPKMSDYLLFNETRFRPGGLFLAKTPGGEGIGYDISLADREVTFDDAVRFQTFMDAQEDFWAELPAELHHCLPAAAALGGAQPKICIDWMDELWVLKLPNERHVINMAAAEAGCLDLCEMAGIAVPDREVRSFGPRSSVLLVKRFDRVSAPGGRIRRHMISSLTLLERHEMDRGVSGYADIYLALRASGAPSVVGEDLYRRMLMNVLCGNTDDHYRNHAFFQKDDGSFTPTPVYDVTPTIQVSPSRRLFLHLGRAGCGRDATVENAVSAASSLDVERDRAIEIANELSLMVARSWKDAMRRHGASDVCIERMATSFSEAGNTIACNDPGLNM
ncbi:HipA domain-containing protein [Sulfitobacter sp. 1A13353]|uniref:HipA domain-containing protein n=1 Tax=Sulfitobacter sp. 1A13353 TaxID=3368568 RepID=UPI0037455B7C